MATKTASKKQNASVTHYYSIAETNNDNEQMDAYVIEFVDDLFEDFRKENVFKRLTKEELFDIVHDYINEQEEYFGKYYKFDPMKQEDMDGVMDIICRGNYEYDTDDEEEDEFWIDYYSEKSQAEANYQ